MCRAFPSSKQSQSSLVENHLLPQQLLACPERVKQRQRNGVMADGQAQQAATTPPHPYPGEREGRARALAPTCSGELCLSLACASSSWHGACEVLGQFPAPGKVSWSHLLNSEFHTISRIPRADPICNTEARRMDKEDDSDLEKSSTATKVQGLLPKPLEGRGVIRAQGHSPPPLQSLAASDHQAHFSAAAPSGVHEHERHRVMALSHTRPAWGPGHTNRAAPCPGQT